MTHSTETGSPDLRQLQDQAQEAARVLRAISHEARVQILCHLVDGERSVGELAEIMGIRQSAVSQHLMRLRADALVEFRREGKMIYYAFAHKGLIELLKCLSYAIAPNGGSTSDATAQV